MAQLINFDNFKPDQNRKGMGESFTSGVTPVVENKRIETEPLFIQTLEVLVKNNPNKVLFSIREAASILGVGEEFIRRRIKSGAIKATYLGDKPNINISELARISTEGV